MRIIVKKDLSSFHEPWLRQVDEWFGYKLLSLGEVHPGIQMERNATINDAIRYIATGGLGTYPLVQAEADALAIRPIEAAQGIVAAHKSHMSGMVSLKIERRKTKEAIRLCKSSEEIELIISRMKEKP